MPTIPRLLQSWIPLVLCMALPLPTLGAGREGPPTTAAEPLASPAQALGIPVGQKITLAEALAYARAHQPAVRAALARVQEEKANAEVPRAQYYPLVGVTAQLLGGTANNTTASYLSTPFVDLPRIGGTARRRPRRPPRWKPYASTLVGVGAAARRSSTSVASRPRPRRRTRASPSPARAAETVGLDIEFDVEEAFFAVHAAKAILHASEDAYERSRVHRDFARAGVKSGLRSPIELTRAEADLSRFDMGRIRARGGRGRAQRPCSRRPSAGPT